MEVKELRILRVIKLTVLEAEAEPRILAKEDI